MNYCTELNKRHRRPFKVIVSVVTSAGFFFNIFAYDLAYAEKSTLTRLEYMDSNLVRVDPSTFVLPEYLGTIRDSWISTPRRGQPSNPSLARGGYESPL